MPDLDGLAGRLLLAQEEERRRIAREMHDDLAQRLAVLGFDLEDLQAKRREGSAILDEDLTKIIRSVGLLAAGVREISRRIYPAMLEHLGLAAALGDLVEDFARTNESSVRILTDLSPDRVIPLPVSTTLYRIAQEALRNTVGHSRNGSAVVELKEMSNPDRLQLVIRDNGVGFDPEAVEAAGIGLGLAGMVERALAIGGRMTLHSAPGAGTIVQIVVPLPAGGKGSLNEA